MNDRELEKKIMSSYRNIAPDILDSVLANCDAQKGQVIVMQANRKKSRSSLIRNFAGLAAALLLVFGGTQFYRGNHAVASTVMLDVNPGIGINVNKAEKVLTVKPYNKDAEVVIGNMDFSGSSLDVAVNALIGSMLRNGYISNDANSVLISVDSKDASAGQAMQTRLMNEVSGIMESGNISASVLGQTVSDDAALQALADQYGITIGKAKLIDQITTQNTLYTFADLVPLTINELNLISESGSTKLENIESIGTASSSAYIGEQSAKSAAFQRAQINESDAARVKCSLDWEKGIMVYEVDFDSAGYEYEVDVDAITGEVVKFDREKDDDFRSPTAHTDQTGQKVPATQASPSDAQLSEEAAAKSAAFRHAGVEESEVLYCDCEQDHKRGIRIYEIEFVANGFEYEYDVNAETSEVIRYSKEKDDDFRARQSAASPSASQNQKPSASAKSGTDDIGADAAKAAALAHAGVTDIRQYECEPDFEKGRAIYEISFVSGGYEYEYEIAAADGSVLKFEKERD